MVQTGSFRAGIVANYSAEPDGVTFENLTLEYVGFLYVPGKLAGTGSAKYLLSEWTRIGPARAAALPMGRFFACVHDRNLSTDYVFVDNAGMFAAYRMGQVVSPSFRHLALGSAHSGPKINPQRAMEFLLYSHVPGNRTLCDTIERIDGREVLEIQPAKVHTLQKNLPELGNAAGLSANSLGESFGDLAFAVSEMASSVDLTGGIDSRFIATFLHKYRASFETALSAKSIHEDVVNGKAVATVLRRDHFVTDPPAIDAIDLDAIYNASDAMFGTLEAVGRKGKLQRDRRARGTDLAMDGTGGELYKDFWWLQDFPRYNRPKANIARLYNMRIEPVRMPAYLLSASAQELAVDVRRSFLDWISTIPGNSNTEIYDRVYYERMRGTSSLLNGATRLLTGLDSYSPLLEFERVRFAYQLPRRIRSFDGYMRSELTRLSPEVARLPTTRGVSARAGRAASLQLASGYALNMAKRTLNKASQRTTGRTLLPRPEPGDSTAFVEHMKQSEHFPKAVDILKDQGLLDQDLQIEEIPASYAMRVYVLGRFGDELG